MAEVKLHGRWPSPYSYRVIWALNLKGIPYEYVEEDLSNKRDLLLKYNPVHKKVPVLVHGGKPICESMVILEYLDQTWPRQYPLLPTDPYERAVARFWVNFMETKGLSIWQMLYKLKGEEQEKAKDSVEVLETIEEHAMKSGQKYFGGDKIGMVDIWGVGWLVGVMGISCIVDIAFNGLIVWLEVIEEILGIKVLEAHKFPRLHAWTCHFKQAPVIIDNLPDRDKLVVFIRRRREMFLALQRA